MKNFVQEVVAKNKGTKFMINPEGEISISDAISQLIEPYKVDAPNYKSFHTLVGFACVAWNASLLPIEEQDQMLEKMLTEVPSKNENRAETLRFLKELMKRKRRLFPNVSRAIVEYKVTDLGNDFHIAVASTLEK